MNEENQEGKKTMSTYLPNPVISRLKKHVKQTCGNLSWLMENIITKYLDEVEGKE